MNKERTGGINWPAPAVSDHASGWHSRPQQNRRVAIKMVRNVPKYRDAAMIEIKILKDLRKHFDEHAPFVMVRNFG